MGHVFRAMGFNCAQNIPPQKKSTLFGDQIPVLWVQIVDAISKGEAEPGGTMAFLMACLYGLNGRREAAQRISHFTCHGALEWQVDYEMTRPKDLEHQRTKGLLKKLTPHAETFSFSISDGRQAFFGVAEQ